jgi:hypothetical protein
MDTNGTRPRVVGVRPHGELGHRIVERCAFLFNNYYLPGITPSVETPALLAPASGASRLTPNTTAPRFTARGIIRSPGAGSISQTTGGSSCYQH